MILIRIRNRNLLQAGTGSGKKFRIRNSEFGAHLFIYNMVGGVAQERPVVCVEEHFLWTGLTNMCTLEKPQKQREETVDENKFLIPGMPIYAYKKPQKQREETVDEVLNWYSLQRSKTSSCVAKKCIPGTCLVGTVKNYLPANRLKKNCQPCTVPYLSENNCLPGTFFLVKNCLHT